MKAMKCIIVSFLLLILPTMTASAQFTSGTSGNPRSQQAPMAVASNYQFRSTSSLSYSGSTLPKAAQSGVMITGNAPGEEHPVYTSSGPRRIGGSGSETGGNEAEENDDPQETPIGDGVWAMLLMAAGYLIYRVRSRKREVMI